MCGGTVDGDRRFRPKRRRSRLYSGSVDHLPPAAGGRRSAARLPCGSTGKGRRGAHCWVVPGLLLCLKSVARGSARAVVGIRVVPCGEWERSGSKQAARGTRSPVALLHLMFVAEPLAAVRARHAATDFARKHGAADQTVDDIALAVSEAVTNAVVHGYRDRPTPGDITMSIRRDGHYLVVLVCDDGVGISPRRDSPGLGIGLALIGQLTESLQIRDRHGGGAELSMRFRLQQDE